MSGEYSTYGGHERRIQGFDGGIWGKEPLGKPRRRWEGNIKMDLQEVGCGSMDWIYLDQDRDRWWTLVNAIMNLRVPQHAGNFLTTWEPVSFSRRTLLRGVSMQVCAGNYRIRLCRRTQFRSFTKNLNLYLKVCWMWPVKTCNMW